MYCIPFPNLTYHYGKLPFSQASLIYKWAMYIYAIATLSEDQVWIQVYGDAALPFSWHLRSSTMREPVSL